MADIDNENVTTLTNDENLNLSEDQTELDKDGKARNAKGKDKSGTARDARRKKDDALEGKDDTHKSHSSESDEASHGHDEKGGTEEDSSAHSQQSLQSGQTTVQFSSGGNAGFSGALTSLLGLFASSAGLVRAEAAAGLGIAIQTSGFAIRPFVLQVSTQGEAFFGLGNKGFGIVNLFSAAAAESGGTKLNFGTELLQTSHSITHSQEVGINITSTSITTSTITDTSSENTPFTFIESIGIPFISTGGTIFFFSPTIPFAFQSPQIIPSEVNTYFSGGGLPPTSNYNFTVLTPIQTNPPTDGGGNQQNNNTPPPSTITTILPDTPTVNGVAVTGYSSLGANVTTTALSTTLTTDNIPKGISFTQSGDISVNVDYPMSVLINAIPVGSPSTATGLTFRVDAGPGTLINAPNSPFSQTSTMVGTPIVTTQPVALSDSLFIDSGADTIVGNSTAFALNVPNASSIIANNLWLATPNGVGGYTLSGIDRGSLSNFVYTFGLIPGYAVVVQEFNMSNDYVFPSSTIFRHTGGNTPPTVGAYGNFSSFDNTNIQQISYSTIQELDNQGYNLTFGGNVLDVYGTKYGEGDVLVVNLPTGANSAGNTNVFTMGGNTLAGFGTYYGDLQSLIINAQPGNTAASVADSDFYFKGNLLAVDVSVKSTLYPHLQTLDMETAPNTVDPEHPWAPSNVHLTFQDSLVEGSNVLKSISTDGNTYNNDIEFLSNVGSPNAYNGFLGPLTDITTNGIEKVTTTDNDNNSITWGNNIYTTENVPNAQNTTPLDLNHGAPNTYNITLLGNTSNVPIAEGNNLYLGVNPLTDIINIQITPDIFRALDGADQQGHDKVITPADLNTAATFSSLNKASLAAIDSFFATYLNQISPNHDVSGTTISFDGTNGGSLSFIEPSPFSVPTIIDPQTGEINPLVGGFLNFAHINIGANLGTAAVFAYAPDQITATHQSQLPPNETPPYVYGNFSPNVNTPTPYFIELDNFFGNSVLAKYSINGAPTSTETFPSGITGTVYTPFDGVTIDEFGTITVSSTTPILATLNITATDQNQNSATTPIFFGFLDAPIGFAAANTITYGQVVNNNSPTNIIFGGLGSTIIGEGPFSNLSITNSNNQPPIGSNLIVDTAGNSSLPTPIQGGTAYGDFVEIGLTAQGTGNTTLASTFSPPSITITQGTTLAADSPATVDQHGEISSTFNFKANAFDVTNGSVFGVAQKLTITADGGSSDSIQANQRNSTGLTLTDSGIFNSNHINFGTQTIYGYSYNTIDANNNLTVAPIFGDMQTLSISGSAGTNDTIKYTSHTSNTPPAASLDISSHIESNNFQFDSVKVIVQGDNANTMTSVYPHLQNLLIAIESGTPKLTASNETFTATATFSNNSFVFGDSVVTGGLGKLTVNADVNLIPNAQFSSPITGFEYDGFINPVQVTSVNNHIVTTTNDGYNNSITWGNDTLTGGQGTNTYVFNLLENSAGTISPNSNYNPNGSYTNSIPIVDSYGVFSGNDTITNFKVSDVLTFNIEQPLYNEILQAAQNAININPSLASILSTSLVTPADLDLIATFNGNTIYFNVPTISNDGNGNGNQNTPIPANGTLTLDGLPQAITSFLDLYTASSTSIQINKVTTTTNIPVANPASAANPFDPVFINLTNGQPLAFAGLVSNANPATLTYTAQELPFKGISLDPNGTLNINVTGPIDSPVTVTFKASNGSSDTTTVHIFTIGGEATYIDYETNNTVTGDKTGGAYEVIAETVYAGGGQDLGSQTVPMTTSTTYGSNLIYDTNFTASDNTTFSHTIVGDVPNIRYDMDNDLQGKTFTFNSNLMNILAGPSVIDNIYGITKTFELDTPPSPQLIAHNTFIFGNPANTTTISIDPLASPDFGNTIYGTGNVYGDMQKFALAQPGVQNHGIITTNTFYFEANNLTSGSYANGSNTLQGSILNTNLYAGIDELDISLSSNITNNALIFGISQDGSSFGSSQLNAGPGPINAGPGPTTFFPDVANLSGSDFALPVSVVSNPLFPNQVSVQDSFNNTITFGNDTFNGNNTGTNTYIINLLFDKDTNNAVMEGNLTLKNYSPTDSLTFNLVAPLYYSMEQADSLGNPDNRLVTFSSNSLAIPGMQANGPFITFDNGNGGSIAFNGSFSIPAITPDAGLIYFAEKITTNVAPTLPILFNHTNAISLQTPYYSVFDPYFNNIDVKNTGSTYTVTSLVPGVPLSSDLTFANNVVSSSDHTIAGFNSGVPVLSSTTNSTPVLDYVNVALNDVHFPTNNPNINLFVGVYNGGNAGTVSIPDIAGLVIGKAASNNVEQLFEPTTSQTQANAYIFQGNMGNENSGTGYSITPNSNTVTHSTNIGGDNLFFDPFANTTAYGLYQEINFNFTNSDIFFTDGKYILQNQTYNMHSNAFNIDGTVYGIASSLTITVQGVNNLDIPSNTGITFDNSTNISSNTFNLESQTIFGSGTLVGDLLTLNIDVMGGSFNSDDSPGSTLAIQTNFTSNTFNFESNVIDAIGSAATNDIYGNVNQLYLLEQVGTGNSGIGTIDASVSLSNNNFIFQPDTLIGGTGVNNFFGHLSIFGNSEDPTIDGAVNFYTGVSVDQNLLASNIVKITDGNNNSIQWGDNTYTGGTGQNIYNFTIVGTNAANPQPIMQGFDTITNFFISTNQNTPSDQLVFNIAYPVYATLAGSNALTASVFLNSPYITITPSVTNEGTVANPNDFITQATITFAGGGSITLEGLSIATTPNALDTDNIALIKDALLPNSPLNPAITITVADPITAVANPTSNFLVFGSTIAVGNASDVNTWNQFFNTGHELSANIDGIKITNGTADFSNMNSGITDTNTGIVDTTISKIIASDLATTATSQNTSSIQILALSGATVIDQSTGAELGDHNANVIIGYGQSITGAGASGDIFYSQANNSHSTAFGQKLIYDVASQVNPVVGDIGNITYDPTSTNTSGGTVNLTGANLIFGNLVTQGQATFYQNNFIEVIPSSSSIDFTQQKTYGDDNAITFTVTGAISSSITATTTNEITSNSIIAGNNTIMSPGTIYGDANTITLNAIDGYAQTMSGVENIAQISNNTFIFGNGDFTGSGANSIIYGDASTLELVVSLPANTNQVAGDGIIKDNSFIFGANKIVGSSDGGSLYAGVGTFQTLEQDSSLSDTQQPYHGAIFDNTFIFGDSHLTASGGTTYFYGDMGNYSDTYLDTGSLTFANGSTTIYQDNLGNQYTFGNDTFTGSTASGAVNVFNVNLFISYPNWLLAQEVMAPGNTTVEHFSASGSKLDLILSKALDTAITGNASGTGSVSASALDNFLTSHFGVTFDTTTSPGDTIIKFHGLLNDAPFSHTTEQLGSITVDGHYTSFVDMGAKLEITVGDPITTMSSAPGTPNTFNVDLPGNTLSNYNQTTNIQNVDSLGHIVDFNGTINLNMSNDLFKALGLSDTNTTAQNLQVLQNDINSSTGGIAVTTTTSGSGANAVTNTVLNVEAIHNGLTAAFGSINIMNTHFDAQNPLVNHLNITHH